MYATSILFAIYGLIIVFEIVVVSMGWFTARGRRILLPPSALRICGAHLGGTMVDGKLHAPGHDLEVFFGSFDRVDHV